MKLKIGTVRSDYAGFNGIAKLFDQAKGLLLEEIDIDFSGCGFFDANMTAPLYAVVARIRDGLNYVSVSSLSSDIETILRKNRFLAKFEKDSMPDTNKTTIPFKVFKLRTEEQFFEYLAFYMRGKGIPAMSEGLTRRFRQSLVEIFSNAGIHSQSKAGIYTCGQFFPHRHQLDFTIADSGVGIRDNVRRHMENSNVSSVAAIRWALAEGHTTKADGPPGGLGLKLLKEFISVNMGKLHIVSRFGYYQFSAEGENLQELEHDFPGTCVNIEINALDTSSYSLKTELASDGVF